MVGVRHAGRYVVAFVVLLSATLLLVGRETLLQLGDDGHPVHPIEVDHGSRVSFQHARWRLRRLERLDTSSIKLEDWEDPVLVQGDTRLVATTVEFTPAAAFVGGDALDCSIELRAPDGRRWGPGVLVPPAALPESASCRSDAEGKPLLAGGSYELRSVFLVPSEVDAAEFALELRVTERTLQYLRFTQR